MSAAVRLRRAVAAVGLGAALAVAGAPVAAQAASYPPASTGTFAVTAHPGANAVTVTGLGADAPATALVSGNGLAPTLGQFTAAVPAVVPAATTNLALGRTDGSGAITFTLVFPEDVSGVYNISVSTPDGHSISGSITLPARSGGPLAWTGTNIALWVVWLAGILVVVGVIALLIAAARRRSRS
ncbi:MAG TPA: hypothetical protein VGC45_10400 [Gryllotalpicola sp.]